MVNSIEIDGRLVGPGHPCFIIAEAGVNHNGNPELAHRLLEVSVQAGADAVKYQTFKAERLATAGAPNARYQSHSTEQHESQLDMLRRLELSGDVHRELIDGSKRLDVCFLSTPFDELSADFLDELGVSAFKIASGELTNLPFLEHVARKGKPMIISTGMATLEEVESAVRRVEKAGNPPIILLHCVSSYPASPQDVNLRAMLTMAAAFDRPVGYSDHTMGTDISIAAVALGACVIEKHVTLDRASAGPDHRSSVEPHELAALVKGIRTVEQALGSGVKRPANVELEIASVVRKSVVAAQDIPAGSRLTVEMLAIKRPGTGLSPVMRETLVGHCAKVHIPAGTLVSLDMIS